MSASRTMPGKATGIVIAVTAVAVLGLAYWPTLRWMVNSWLSSEYYSQGFLVPAVSAVLIWARRDHLRKTDPSASGIWWLLAGALLYMAGIFWVARYLGGLSLLSVLTGLVLSIYGTRAGRALWFPLAFLLFMVPLPFIPELAYHLQTAAVFSSSHLLMLTGLPVSLSGAEIYLDKTVFSVGIPCSGINSFLALLALGTLLAYILSGPLARRLGLPAAAIALAVVTNILRIVSIILVAYFYNVQTATGWYHDISSPIFFTIAFLGLALIAWGMGLKLKLDYRD